LGSKVEFIAIIIAVIAVAPLIINSTTKDAIDVKECQKTVLGLTA
jgi:hypothetical protein